MSATAPRDEFLQALAARCAGRRALNVHTTCREGMAIRSDALHHMAVGARGQAGSHPLKLALGRLGDGLEAMRGFLQHKSVWIGLGDMPQPFPARRKTIIRKSFPTPSTH